MQKKLSLEEIKIVEFDILKKYVGFCEEHNLSYFLTYGTLLGAVRHGGFIPWDDDVDVMMPRNDYERFIKLVVNTHEIDGCELLTREKTNGYYYPFVKLCDKSTVAKMEDNNTPHGIWIDIFPMDYVPNDESKTRRFHRKIKMLKNMIISYTTDFKTKNRNYKYIPKIVLAIITHFIGVNRIAQYIERESQKYNNKKTNKLAIVCWQSAYGGNLDVSDILIPSKVMFNGIQMNAPVNYHGYLESIYGQYMIIPPENKRATHHLIAYKNIES